MGYPPPCITGCAIGEMPGLVIGTVPGWDAWAIVALAVGLAFFFGYALTAFPLLRFGLPLAMVAPIALAADTISIAMMEIVDNTVMLLVPGALEAGAESLLFWGSLALALAVAYAVAMPVNPALIARGWGHTVAGGHHVHATR